MAAMHGKGGTAVFASLTFEMLSWSVDATADVAEATAMAAANGAKIYLAGFKDWTATAECLLPKAGGGVAALGTTAALTFDTVTDGGLAYAGSAICTGFSPTSDKDGVATITFSFQGSAILTEA